MMTMMIEQVSVMSQADKCKYGSSAHQSVLLKLYPFDLKNKT